jgi:cyclopropane fatty-acyl-phospholipid synthase-like methyltransferase
MEKRRIQEIVDYYDYCECDFKYHWHLDDCKAMHIGFWDNQTANLRQALIRQNEIMALKANITSQDQVLDAGCGIGGSAVFLVKNYGCKVTGITLSKKQAESADSFAKLENVEQLTKFYVMDFNQTAFQDQTFDVVWVLESFCYADDKKAFIREVNRILKKNGRLILADAFETRRKYKLIERKAIDGWIKRWAVNSLITKQEFRRHLKNHGFGNIEYIDISKNVEPSSRKLFFRSLLALPAAKIAQWKGYRNRIQNENVLGAINQYLTVRLQLCEYGMFYAEKS